MAVPALDRCAQASIIRADATASGGAFMAMHIVVFLVYAAASVGLAAGLPVYMPAIGYPLSSAAGAFLFLLALNVHQWLARREERLDLLEALYDLDEKQRRTAEELDGLRQRIEKSGERNQDLVSEMRIVRGLLARLTERKATAPGRAADSGEKAPLARPQDEETLLGEVRAALEANRVDLYLQPIVALPQRRPRHFEVFSRIRNQAGEVILPEHYIPIAEQHGLMATIDNFLLFRTVQIIRLIRRKGLKTAFFLNMSPSAAADREFMDQFASFLVENRELADFVVLEFNAADLLGHDRRLSEQLQRLKDFGYRLSVDGIDTLSVDYTELARRKVDFAKIDCALLLDVDQQALASTDPGELREAMGEYGLQLIATHVEDENSVIELLDAGVDLAQGYLFSSPRLAREML